MILERLVKFNDQSLRVILSYCENESCPTVKQTIRLFRLCRNRISSQQWWQGQNKVYSSKQKIADCSAFKNPVSETLPNAKHKFPFLVHFYTCLVWISIALWLSSFIIFENIICNKKNDEAKYHYSKFTSASSIY